MLTLSFTTQRLALRMHCILDACPQRKAQATGCEIKMKEEND